MTAVELDAIVRSCMPAEFYMRPGTVLYSSLSSVRPFHAYVMGLNPGGDPAVETKPLVETLAAPNGQSFYTHDCWQKYCPGGGSCAHLDESGAVLPDALRSHQQVVVDLADVLGTTPAMLPSANAIFGRSREIAKLKEESGHSLAEWWAACWPVHQRLLAIVRPRVIVTLGKGNRNSAFALLNANCGYPPWRTFSDEGVHGGKAFEACGLDLGEGERLDATVIGIPHPSWYAPGPLLREMIRECAAGLLAA
jgi:hypothetical protein